MQVNVVHEEDVTATWFEQANANHLKASSQQGEQISTDYLYQTSPLLTRMGTTKFEMVIWWSVQEVQTGQFSVFAHYSPLSLSSRELIEPCKWEADFKYFNSAKQYCVRRFMRLANLLKKEKFNQEISN